MNTWKNLAACFALAIVLAAGLLAGCDEPAEPQDPGKLEYQHFEYLFERYLNEKKVVFVEKRGQSMDKLLYLAIFQARQDSTRQSAGSVRLACR